MKKLCTILIVLSLALLCVVLLPTQTHAASESDLTFTLAEDGNSYIVTDCDTAAEGSLSIPAVHEGKPVTAIGDKAFEDCASLTDVTIPEGVTTIGNSAFRDCTGLLTITLPESVNEIANAAFSYCTRLVSVNIPYGVETISSDTFYKCYKLASITIPDSVTDIAPYAFYYCRSLTEITIPSSVRSLSVYAFANCTKLVSVDMQAQLTAIPDYAFVNCKELRSIVIPNGVTTIGDHAFDYCLLLINVGIPDSVTSIGVSAFDNFDFLSFVFYCGTEEQWNAISMAEGNENLTKASRSHHKFSGGDCTTPQTCGICGVEGANGHRWVAATCTVGQYCSVCEATVQPALGHTWTDATCTAPKTCSVCGETEGEALGHTWTDATCTAPKTCSVCGETEGTVQHTYDGDADGDCNVCGEVRFSIDTNLKFLQAPGLSFKDYIGLQLLASNSVLNGYEKFYIQAVQVTPNGNVETILEGTPYYSAYQKFEHQVLSWSMTEQITLTLCGEKDGVLYRGQTVATTVQELSMSKLASYKAANNTKAVTALVDMLNYGAAVQTAFNYNVASLPNLDLGEFADMGTTTTPAFAAENTKTGTGSVAVMKDSISMRAKVEIQLLFGVDISAYTVKATVGDEEVAVVLDTTTYAGYGWTMVKVAIGADKMRENYTIALYDAEGNPVTQVYDVSIEAYAKAQLGGTYNDVVVAMMRYGDSVAAL